jgi:hypothetical protein
VVAATHEQIAHDFALVGGFSLDDSSEEPLIKAADMRDVAYPPDPDLSNLPASYTPFPTTTTTIPWRSSRS